MTGEGGGEPLAADGVGDLANDHQGNAGQGSTPILVFDAMWAVVNWQDVAKRYEAAKSRTDVLLLVP